MGSTVVGTSKDIVSDGCVNETIKWGVDMCNRERQIRSPPRPNRQQSQTKAVRLERKDQKKAVSLSSAIGLFCVFA